MLSGENEHSELKKLRHAADSGDAEAQGKLGTLLAMGEEVPRDVEEALKWLHLAAEQGDLTSLFNLGIIYEQGLGGVPSDMDEAALWYWQAAEMGDTGAKMKLGTMLIKGAGFSPGSKVIAAIRASADKDMAYAKAFLGKLYLEGTGLEQSDADAETWFRKAAKQGDEGAMFNLGEMLVEGRTIETSEDEAAQWFYDFGMNCLKEGNIVKAFDCLVSIKRIIPEHFLAQRLEDEIERQNENRPRGQ